MAYITKSKYNKIIRSIDCSRMPDLKGSIYIEPIYFFSKFEEKKLLYFQLLLRTPERFFEVYQKYPIKKDTYTYVYEYDDAYPAYHCDIDCPHLTSDFENYKIPELMQVLFKHKSNSENSGDSRYQKYIEEFRDWFKNDLDPKLFENDDNQDLFILKLNQRWGLSLEEGAIKFSDIKVKWDNSKVKNIENYELKELEKELKELEEKIHNIIRDSKIYFRENPDKQEIIKRFQKRTYLAYKDDEILDNNTAFSDAQLKEFLLFFDENFKQKIWKLLIEYYKVKFNPELSFEGKLLEQLNFRPCQACHNNNKVSIESIL